MAIIPKPFIDAVVSIGNKSEDGTISWIGTGFFVIRKDNKDKSRAIPFLVSNKHVFELAKQMVIRMKEKDVETLKVIDANLYDKENPLFFLHPTMPESIDIAVLPLNAQFIKENNLEFPNFDIDEQAMSSSELLDNGVDEGSLVHMLGFPMGLVEESGLPICRLGCVARISMNQISLNHNILVDIQNFPGNSGSPIIYRPELSFIKGTKNLKKSVLMGVIHSYIPYEEHLISTQTKQIVEKRQENSGIALMHPVEYIRDIIDVILPN